MSAVDLKHWGFDSIFSVTQYWFAASSSHYFLWHEINMVAGSMWKASECPLCIRNYSPLVTTTAYQVYPCSYCSCIFGVDTNIVREFPNSGDRVNSDTKRKMFSMLHRTFDWLISKANLRYYHYWGSSWAVVHKIISPASLFPVVVVLGLSVVSHAFHFAITDWPFLMKETPGLHATYKVYNNSGRYTT